MAHTLKSSSTRTFPTMGMVPLFKIGDAEEHFRVCPVSGIREIPDGFFPYGQAAPGGAHGLDAWVIGRISVARGRAC
jgi:hypothetical protein